MTTPLVTVVIPTIKPRKQLLRRAVNSVIAQNMKDYPAPAIEIAHDLDHAGAAPTRNRALLNVKTPWVAFLDDDDFFLPHHLATLLDAAKATKADVVYPKCRVIGPHKETIDLSSTLRHDRPFDADALQRCNYIPVTTLVNTEMAQAALFGPPDQAVDEQFEDYGFLLRLLDAEATFVHVPVVTWVWHHHGKNTAGQGDRW